MPKQFEQTVGSRALVWHGKALKTAGGLKRQHLIMNKHGRIVSKKLHEQGKKHGLNRLRQAGYAPFSKGSAGVVRRISRR